MCDYSLEMYRSRPARAGEQLTSFRFPSGSIGFAEPGSPATNGWVSGASACAVCIQPDTKLILTNLPDSLHRSYALPGTVAVVFAQRATGLYRDGVRLADGRFLSLQDLPPGVTATVASNEVELEKLRAIAAAPAPEPVVTRGTEPEPEPNVADPAFWLNV